MLVYNPYQKTRSEIADLVSTIDFFPTILDIFDLNTSLEFAGQQFFLHTCYW